MNWQHKISDIAARILTKRHVPILLKEAAWKLLRFVVKCGQSNPLSFALRPIVSHNLFRPMVGGIMVLLALSVAVWNPIPSFAGKNTGGTFTVNVLPEGEVTVTTNESVVVPVKYNYISQRFWRFHPGIDFAGRFGEPVFPVMNGTVTRVLRQKWDYGNHIYITHTNGLESLYAHLSKIGVVEGQVITTATEIGQLGSTGRSTGPHLHLEIYDSGRPINPATLLDIK
jgi:murein DD-endopeptidase MepM/ murein hydrolase activator NlpD